jgi:hypothetical protein
MRSHSRTGLPTGGGRFWLQSDSPCSRPRPGVSRVRPAERKRPDPQGAGDREAIFKEPSSSYQISRQMSSRIFHRRRFGPYRGKLRRVPDVKRRTAHASNPRRVSRLRMTGLDGRSRVRSLVGTGSASPSSRSAPPTCARRKEWVRKCLSREPRRSRYARTERRATTRPRRGPRLRAHDDEGHVERCYARTSGGSFAYQSLVGTDGEMLRVLKASRARVRLERDRQ